MKIIHKQLLYDEILSVSVRRGNECRKRMSISRRFLSVLRLLISYSVMLVRKHVIPP